MEYIAQEVITQLSSTRTSPGWYFWLILNPSNRTENTIDISYTLRIRLFSSESWSGDGIPFTTVIKVGNTIKEVPVKGRYDVWSGTTMHTFTGTFTVDAANDTTSLPVTLRNYTTSSAYPNAGGTLVETSGRALTIPVYEYPYSIPTIDGTARLGSAFTILTNRERPTYTHTIRVSVGDTQVYSGIDIETSASVTIPVSYASATSSSVTATIQCTTIDAGEVIGTYNGTFPVYMPEDAKPSIVTILNPDNSNLPITYNGYVKGYSKVTATMVGTGKYGATITGYALNEVSSASNVITSEVLNQSGNINITTSVTDSRGLSTSETSIINVVDYNSPTLNNGQFTRVDGGINFQCSGNYTSLDGANSPSVSVTWQGQTFNVQLTLASGYYTGILNIGGDVPGVKTEAIVTVTDSIGGSNNYTITLESHEIPLELNAAHDAVGLGKTPIGHRKVEIAWDVEIGNEETNLSLLLNGQPVGGIVESGTDGAWKYRKYSDGTASIWTEVAHTGVTYPNTWTSYWRFSATFTTPAFPSWFTLENITGTAVSDSESGVIGLLRLMSGGTKYCFIRPDNYNGNGKVHFKAYGRWQ